MYNIEMLKNIEAVSFNFKYVHCQFRNVQGIHLHSTFELII